MDRAGDGVTGSVGQRAVTASQTVVAATAGTAAGEHACWRLRRGRTPTKRKSNMVGHSGPWRKLQTSNTKCTYRAGSRRSRQSRRVTRTGDSGQKGQARPLAGVLLPADEDRTFPALHLLERRSRQKVNTKSPAKSSRWPKRSVDLIVIRN